MDYETQFYKLIINLCCFENFKLENNNIPDLMVTFDFGIRFTLFLSAKEYQAKPSSYPKSLTHFSQKEYQHKYIKRFSNKSIILV